MPFRRPELALAVAALAAVATCLVTAAPAGATPSRCDGHRPLRTGSPGPAYGEGYRLGPVWLLGLLGAGTDSDAGYPTKTLVVRAGRARAPLVIRGWRCRGDARLRFWFRDAELPFDVPASPATLARAGDDAIRVAGRGNAGTVQPDGRTRWDHAGYTLLPSPARWLLAVYRGGRFVAAGTVDLR